MSETWSLAKEISSMMQNIVPPMMIVTLASAIIYLIAPSLRGRCKFFFNHNFEATSCKVNWVHCSVCAIEMREPFNYHPLVRYKCSRCGEEVDELDWENTKSLGVVMDSKLREMEEMNSVAV